MPAGIGNDATIRILFGGLLLGENFILVLQWVPWLRDGCQDVNGAVQGWSLYFVNWFQKKLATNL